MDKKYIEENDIEIKYLRNQLTEDELEEFEVYLMDHPEVLDQLYLTQTFALNMRGVGDSGSTRSIDWNFVVTRVFSRDVLVGASFGFVLASILIFTQLGMLLSRGQTDILYLENSRSTEFLVEKIPQIKRPVTNRFIDGVNHFVIIFDVLESEENEYVVSLNRYTNSDNNNFKEWMTFGTKSPDEFGAIRISIPYLSISTGIYELSVTPRDHPLKKVKFNFKVI